MQEEWHSSCLQKASHMLASKSFHSDGIVFALFQAPVWNTAGVVRNHQLWGEGSGKGVSGSRSPHFQWILLHRICGFVQQGCLIVKMETLLQDERTAR